MGFIAWTLRFTPGSCLGPLLFLLYIINLPICISKQHIIHPFPDDHIFLQENTDNSWSDWCPKWHSQWIGRQMENIM